MRPVTRVAIVGAGLAGLAAAAAAGAAGLQVDVFEAEPAPAWPPAPIDVVPSLLRDLVTLGVGDACVRRGFAYRGVAFVDPDGCPRFEIETPALAGVRWPAALGIAYGALLEALRETALARGGRLHWGDPVARCDVQQGHARLATQGGATWQGDLLLVAGARAVQGLSLPLAADSRELPQRWDHVLLPRPRTLDRTTWVVGPGRSKALLVPVSVSQAGLALLRDVGAGRTARELRTQLAAQGGWLAAATASLSDDAPVVGRPVRTGLLAGAWQDGAALRIGSSAHVLPPHFGQAAAQAVEDAVVLQDLLRSPLPRDELCARFMQRRAGRAASVHAITTQAADWDLNPGPATDLHALARRLAPVVERAA